MTILFIDIEEAMQLRAPPFDGNHKENNVNVLVWLST